MHRALRPGGDVHALEELVRVGACIDSVDEKGRTALYVAAAEGQADIVSWLLSKGADIEHVAEDGRTALHAAAACGHLDVCQAILDVASRNGSISRALQATDARGRTAGDIAHAAQHLDVVRTLLGYLQRRTIRVANESRQG